MNRPLVEMTHLAIEPQERLALVGPTGSGKSSLLRMIPILNTMSIAGIVSFPGMMTGQLLAGAPPMQAVQYQIMIMFVVAAAIAIGVMVVLTQSFFSVTTKMHQIDWQQIRSVKIENRQTAESPAGNRSATPKS